MTERRYVRIGYPWAASYEAGERVPLSYLTSLIRQTLRYGMPARRYGRGGAWIVRRAVAEKPLRAALRVRRRGPRPDVDRVLDLVAEGWNSLAASSVRLPSSAPERLTALALRRRSADTVFVFGDDRLLLVCKTPRGEATTLELEANALREAASASVGPLSLGKLDDVFVQEALPGSPLQVTGITPSSAARLPWAPEHAELVDGLVRLAENTKRVGPPQELRPELRVALEKADVHDDVRKRALSALEDLERFEGAVLRHGDTSPQNCLFEDEKLSGLVDWEIARAKGAPGFDILNASVALVDQGVGLVHWSEERAVESFRLAWQGSAFFEGAREGARRATLAAGGSDADYERLEVAFFARRLASRAASPSSYATGPRSAERMLEIACAR